ncbi:C40 family peptidase [Streptomyces sp. B-S-A8]|uniref:C40 family peptidase n=1 Tax=Streptomyces solicavernae TaxID=3043614 RepID=A0ABT6S0Q4_9ACTN|nr:C40 family peptidase [Streptomyces sp. B-S-A8]MDI3390165.1 C40 family peptidase [Streptomyces sp. B-S-A8]
MRRLLMLGAMAVAGCLMAAYAVVNTVTAPLQGMDLKGVACAALKYKLGKGLKLFQMTSDMKQNAETIISVGASMGISQRGQVVAIATAMQESGLKNIDYGDRDSLGLFQQRPSMGWGTPEQVTDPQYSARKFYNGLQKVHGWESMPITDAAQAVQRSAFPTAYAKHEQAASQIVASAHAESTGTSVQQINSSSGCTPTTTPASAQTRGYVSRAMTQIGKPYVWGGTGPDGFDCSGLIVWAWRQEGYQLKVRTSQQMHKVAVPIPQGQEKSGDLIFTRMAAGGPEHVLIVVKPGLALEAPRTGLDVRVRKYDPAAEEMTFGRIPQSQLTEIPAQV